jgi:hypothetical protein
VLPIGIDGYGAVETHSGCLDESSHDRRSLASIAAVPQDDRSMVASDRVGTVGRAIIDDNCGDPTRGADVFDHKSNRIPSI